MSNIESQMSAIGECSDRDIYTFFHKVLDICCDTTHTEAKDAIQTYLTSNRWFVDKYVPSVWNSEALLAVGLEMYADLSYQFISQVSELGNHQFRFPINERAIQIWQECLEVRQKELFKSLIYKTVTSQLDHIINFDWEVSVVMSSDRMANIKVPILKLTLCTKSASKASNFEEKQNPGERNLFGKRLNGISGNNIISMELDTQELKSFIDLLVKAKEEHYQAVTD